MKRLVAALPGVLVLFLSRLPAHANDRSPCPEIVFMGKTVIAMTDSERRMVCGDPATEGWKSVPLDQAEYFLRSFLQQRGYQDPTFRIEEGKLQVATGAKTTVTKLRVTGLPSGVDAAKLRKIQGQPLTPKELDQIDSTLIDRLQESGYACPTVKLSADAGTGEVRAEVQPGDVFRFDKITPAQLVQVDSRVLDRYQAFEYGDRFDMRLLNLSAQRTLLDELFLSAYFEVDCSTAGMKITQRVVEGKPRSFKIGAGFATEGYWVASAQWKDSRIGEREDQAEVSLVSSFIQQEAETSLHLYASAASRVYLMPSALVELENLPRYEDYVAKASLSPGTSWDDDHVRVNVNGGPSVNNVQMVSGIGPGNDTYVTLDSKTTLTTHMFEYYAKDPREGWDASLQTSSRLLGVDSDITAHQLKLSGEALWNLGDYDPPALILATRGYADTTYVKDPASAVAQLAPDWRYFVGGDGDLRGAALQEIPNNDAGSLTAVYDGLELRLGDVIPYGIQPFLFLDAAMVSVSDFHLDPDVYWSPGIGLRWASPVGTIRMELAHGFVWEREDSPPPYSPNWEFFFSFGEEF